MRDKRAALKRIFGPEAMRTVRNTAMLVELALGFMDRRVL